MPRTGSRTVPRPIQQVLARIEHWRRTRARRTRMPEPLWAAATALAREHGVYRVARALHVNYESLKHRAAVAVDGPASSGFIEWPPALPAASPAAGALVEVSAGDGARLTIRLPAHGSVDVAELTRAFWSRRS